MTWTGVNTPGLPELSGVSGLSVPTGTFKTRRPYLYIQMAKPPLVWTYDGGRVRIPKRILETLKVSPDGGMLKIEVVHGRLVLTPVKLSPT